MEPWKKTAIQLDTSVAAEIVLVFANIELNKVAEADKQTALELVIAELQTWRAGIATTDDYWRVRLRLSK